MQRDEQARLDLILFVAVVDGLLCYSGVTIHQWCWKMSNVSLFFNFNCPDIIVDTVSAVTPSPIPDYL